jgi:hypothetical protein
LSCERGRKLFVGFAAIAVALAAASCNGAVQATAGAAGAGSGTSGVLDAGSGEAETQSASSSGSDTGADTTNLTGVPDAGPIPPQYHRPVAVACNTSGGRPFIAWPDGGSIACAVNADCKTTGGYCRGGLCRDDECLMDSDCPTGFACHCGGAGIVDPSNRCFPTGCRVDADCGDGGYCAPSFVSCGIDGYHCLTTADTCVPWEMCPPVDGGPAVCNYVAQLRHWACVARIILGFCQ